MNYRNTDFGPKILQSFYKNFTKDCKSKTDFLVHNFSFLK